MIEINNVYAGYGKHTVLDGVSARFEKGKLTSVIGVNGCGKSTLLKVTLGILPLPQGKITVDGQNLSLLGRNEIAKRISYLSQGKDTPDMTVEQMVLHGRFPHLSYPRRYTNRDKEISRDAMEAVGISELAHKPLYALSGGMRQNAYIAMALAQDTDYILLDEPTTYLDIAHQLELMRLLRKFADKGKGIVTVMHDLPLAFDFSDEIAVIDAKTIKVQASPMEVSETFDLQSVFGVSTYFSPESGRYTYRY